jgi:hypothetical protein
MKKNAASLLSFQKKIVANFESTKANQAATSKWCNLFGF